MQELSTFSIPLMEATIWRGALLWAIALYIPLSGALAPFEASDKEGLPTQTWRQITLIISSLLLSLVVGLIAQLAASWALGPGWASSLAVITIGWSLFLIAADREANRKD